MELEIPYVDGFDATVQITAAKKKILKKFRNIKAPLLHDHLQTLRALEAISRDNKKPNENFWKHLRALLNSREASQNAHIVENMFTTMVIDDRNSTRLAFVVRNDALMNIFDRIKPNSTIDDDRRLGYLNDGIENDPALYKVQTDFENAASAQATATGSTATPVTYKQDFEEVKTHAKYLDSNDRKKRQEWEGWQGGYEW